MAKPNLKMSDQRGDGAETMTDCECVHEKDDDFTVPEKDPGRTFSGTRASGQTQGIGTKVRSAPSHG